MNGLVGASSSFFVMRYVSRGPLGKKKREREEIVRRASLSKLANDRGNIITQVTPLFLGYIIS